MQIALICPVPTVFIPSRGKKKGLLTSDVYILLGWLTVLDVSVVGVEKAGSDELSSCVVS